MTWNTNAGTKRETVLPPFWPTQTPGPIETEGVCGEVLEHGHFTKNGEKVPTVVLDNVVIRECVRGTWRTRRIGMVTVAVSALLRTALAEARTPRGTGLQITYLRTAPPMKEGHSGMKEFEVREVSGDYLRQLHESAISLG